MAYFTELNAETLVYSKMETSDPSSVALETVSTIYVALPLKINEPSNLSDLFPTVLCLRLGPQTSGNAYEIITN